jgi:hypothetical protein
MKEGGRKCQAEWRRKQALEDGGRRKSSRTESEGTAGRARCRVHPNPGSHNGKGVEGFDQSRERQLEKEEAW